MAKIFMFSYLAFWFGLAVSDIGEIPKVNTAPYTLWFAICVFSVFGLAAYLGYEAGREDASE